MSTSPFYLGVSISDSDSDPDFLSIVDKSNWIAKILVLPRALFPQIRD